VPIVWAVVAVSDNSSVLTLRTERLVLTPWSDDDFDEFVAWSTDRDATRYVLRRPLSSAELAHSHERSLADWRRLGIGKRSVRAARSGRWLGFVDVCFVGPGKGSRADDIELEYFLLPFAWGRGIATEAAAATRDDAFGRGGVSELLGRFRIENEQSGRVLEKLGFSFIRQHTFPDGAVVDVTRLTRYEWQRRIADPGDPSNGGCHPSRPAPTETSWL
jgi:RimJ/RimL family protein N-acetyltransferase